MSKASGRKGWVSGRVGYKLLGTHIQDLMKLALLGRIRTLVEPGNSIKYNLDDINRLKAETEAIPTS
jgi:hypothetical protein